MVPLLAGAPLALGLLAFGIGRIGGGDRPVHIRGDEVALLKPENGAIRRQIAVGRGTGIDRARAGSAWIASRLDETVSRVGCNHDAVIRIPEALAFGAGSLWVADGDARRVLQVDQGTNGVLNEIPVANCPRALAVADGALWVAPGQEGTVDRIDLGRGRVVRKIRLGSDPTAVAAGAGAIWAASEQAGAVTPGSTRTRT